MLVRLYRGKEVYTRTGKEISEGGEICASGRYKKGGQVYDA